MKICLCYTRYPWETEHSALLTGAMITPSLSCEVVTADCFKSRFKSYSFANARRVVLESETLPSVILNRHTLSQTH